MIQNFSLMNQMQQFFAIIELAFVFVLFVLISSLVSYFSFVGKELYKDWKDYNANKTDGHGLMTQVIALLGCCLFFLLFAIFMAISLYLSLGNSCSFLVFVIVAISCGVWLFFKLKKMRQRRV